MSKNITFQAQKSFQEIKKYNFYFAFFCIFMFLSNFYIRNDKFNKNLVNIHSKRIKLIIIYRICRNSIFIIYYVFTDQINVTPD
jgi:hypothetical protein